MRSVGPAGWASHGFFGGGRQVIRNGVGGAFTTATYEVRTFGNPVGAIKGGGAWTDTPTDGFPPKARRDGGNNINGPNQGGGGGGGGGNNFIQMVVTGSPQDTGPYGSNDGAFYTEAWNVAAGGAPTGGQGGPVTGTGGVPAIIGGALVNCFCYFQSVPWDGFNNDVVLAVVGTVPQNAFTSISFVDRDAILETLASASATYDTTDAPGYTMWGWQPTTSFPFFQAGPIAITVV